MAVGKTLSPDFLGLATKSDQINLQQSPVVIMDKELLTDFNLLSGQIFFFFFS